LPFSHVYYYTPVLYATPIMFLHVVNKLNTIWYQGCSPKKEVGGHLKQDLRQRFLNNLGLHTRTLIHVREIARADLWSRPAIQLLVFECL